jgi:hypothetical protein
MKKHFAVLLLMTALVGCEDANKVIDQAQDVTNKVIDQAQEKMASLDFGELNLENFGEATESATKLALSVQEAINADLNDPETLTKAKAHIANSYRCLVDASSETTATRLINKIIATVNSEDVLFLIEQSLDAAETAQTCVL